MVIGLVVHNIRYQLANTAQSIALKRCVNCTDGGSCHMREYPSHRTIDKADNALKIRNVSMQKNLWKGHTAQWETECRIPGLGRKLKINFEKFTDCL